MGQRSAAGRWGFPRFLQIRAAVKVQFAEFTLDTEARRLIRQDAEVHVSSKAFDLLRLLIERRPNMLDKASLHARLWPRTFVVDANLTVLVAELRRALADNAREPRFIRTVHAHGYAFCGDAVDLDAPAPEPAPNGARCWLMWNQRAIVLRDGGSVIGRDPECPVWLDASGVSRSHARIEVERGGDVVRIEDLGSKNGTFVDGSPVHGVVQISNGSEIQVGSVTLTLRVWSRGKAAETERIARRGDGRE
jgi:DNA-binding winged helix-turn-helix (wHTH) protein